MTVLFQDETRLVTETSMFWVDCASKEARRDGYQWSVHDIDGGETFYHTRSEALAALVKLAQDEG